MLEGKIYNLKSVFYVLSFISNYTDKKCIRATSILNTHVVKAFDSKQVGLKLFYPEISHIFYVFFCYSTFFL